MKLTIVPVTPFQQNCSVLCCEATGRGAVVDPGGDLDRVLAVVDEAGIELEKILLTHAHLDHCGATAELARLKHLPIEGPHPDDQFWIDMLPEQSRMFGMPDVQTFTPDRWLAGGDTVSVGELQFAVRHCPGHTPGHVIFFNQANQLALVGDVLFKGSIGRSDFPRGDHATLVRSIREQLWPLGDEVQFVPGHGPVSTFGHERRSNPFCGDGVAA